MTIGERIKNRRKELGLSQEELAKRLGNKTRASVCAVEKDRDDMTTTRIRQYAEALETTPAYLMGWEDNEENEKKLDLIVDDPKMKMIIEAYSRAVPEIQDAALDLLLKFPRTDA